MRINSIHIQNFRSFEDQEIFFHDCQKPITIIGENNAGKSNIVKAILYGLGHKYLGEDSLNESDFFNKNTEEKINLSINITDTLEKVINFESGEDYRDAPTVKIGTKWINKKEKDPIIEKVLFYDFQQVSNLLKIKSDFSYTPLGKIVKKIKEDFKNNKDLLDEMNLKIDEFINDHVAKNVEYTAFKEKLGHILKKNLKNHSENFECRHTIQDVDKIINGLGFYVKENVDKPLISVDNFGSGFRSLLVFSIFEAISESQSGGNVYIFEEPETFLHENFEEYFFILLQKLAENNQVIITTHSKKFVDIFNVETVIRLRNNQDTGHRTIVSQISQKLFEENITDKITERLNDETGNPILTYPTEYGTYLKALEPNIGLIAFSEKIIIVEGPHDVLAYKTSFGKKLEEHGYINSLGYLGLNIVCVHNKDLIAPLILICRFLQTKAFVIFDSDLPLGQEINTDDDFTTGEYRTKEPYYSLDSTKKQHYTKTLKLITYAKKCDFGYQVNCPKLEGVLDFEIDDISKLTYKNKSSLSVFEKLKDKTFEEIRSTYPNFISDELNAFVSLPVI